MGGCYVLDGCQGGIRLEEVGDDLRALHLQCVAVQTAITGKIRTSTGADSSERVWGDALELAKRAVAFEHLRDLGDALDGVSALTSIAVDPT